MNSVNVKLMLRAVGAVARYYNLFLAVRTWACYIFEG